MSLALNAVSPELWSLLKRLMADESMGQFFLVGGTALALRFGHRVSVDIDLFSDRAFDSLRLAELLVSEYGLSEATVEKNTVLGVLDGIKLDCMAHQYPMVVGVEEVEAVRVMAVEDIAAMKLNAIANRGSKKDFWDLYELMQHHNRKEILSFYERKYPQSSLWSVEKSLSYFEDAEADPDPRCLKGRSWDQIKAEIAEWNRL
ncbi:MAG TPA: hypothetical protein DCX06_14090 [Opitutae bacterium]|nr:hypothetical protein [Opitutae bacterium]